MKRAFTRTILIVLLLADFGTITYVLVQDHHLRYQLRQSRDNRVLFRFTPAYSITHHASPNFTLQSPDVLEFEIISEERTCASSLFLRLLVEITLNSTVVKTFNITKSSSGCNPLDEDSIDNEISFAETWQGDPTATGQYQATIIEGAASYLAWNVTMRFNNPTITASEQALIEVANVHSFVGTILIIGSIVGGMVALYVYGGRYEQRQKVARKIPTTAAEKPYPG